MPKRASPAENVSHDADQLLSPVEAMKFLGYKSLNSLYRQRCRGLKAKRINARTFRYWRSDLVAFLEKGANPIAVYLTTGKPKDNIHRARRSS
jgi:hypothetical protein